MSHLAEYYNEITNALQIQTGQRNEDEEVALQWDEAGELARDLLIDSIVSPIRSDRRGHLIEEDVTTLLQLAFGLCPQLAENVRSLLENQSQD